MLRLVTAIETDLAQGLILLGALALILAGVR